MPADLERLMQEALKEAHRGFAEGEVPIGAVVVGEDGRLLASAHNQPIGRHDATAHAEILALRRACSLISNYRLTGATLVVTVEPCVMCMGAAIQARIGRLVFGAADPKAGAAGTLYNLAADDRLNHSFLVVPGILADACRALLQEFFRSRR